jgi:YD repeat-containing protein
MRWQRRSHRDPTPGGDRTSTSTDLTGTGIDVSPGPGRRPRRALLFLMSLALCAATGASLLVGVGQSRGEHTRTHPFVPPAPPRTPPHQRADTTRSFRLTPAQRARALRSETRYDSLDALQARQLAGQKNGILSLASASFYQPLMLKRGERLVRFVNSHEALVREAAPETRRGRMHLLGRLLTAQSDVPMVVGTGKHRRQVDLRLYRTGDAIAPKTPIVPVQFGTTGLTFPSSGVSVRMAGARSSALSSLGNAGFEASVLPDTDVAYQALTYGAEQWFELRSAASPQEIGLRFQLSVNERLRLNKDGSVSVMRGNTAVMMLQAPTASDAAGRLVASFFSIAGATVELHVAHKQSDITYPIAVDPIFLTSSPPNIQDPYNYVDQEIPNGAGTQEATGNPEQFAKWGYYATPPADFGHLLNEPWMPENGNGVELYINGGTAPAAGSYAEFFYEANAGESIQRVDFDDTWHGNDVQIYNKATNTYTVSSQVYEGIAWTSGGDYGWENEQAGDVYGGATNTYAVGEAPYYIPLARSAGGAQAISVVNNAHNGNIAIFGLQSQDNEKRSSTGSDFGYFYGATVWLYDNLAPESTWTPPSNNWQWTDDGNQSYSIDPTATDSGVGVKYFEFGVYNYTGTVSSQGHTNTCSGDHTGTGFCPASWSSAFSYTVPEGTDTIAVSPYDALQNGGQVSNAGEPNTTSNQNWTVRIDRSPPAMQLGGSLWDMRTAASGGSSAQNPLLGGAYELQINATDGSNPSQSGTASGVAEVDVAVAKFGQNGQLGTPQTTVYHGNCVSGTSESSGCDLSSSFNYTFLSAAYPQGEYQIAVTAKDCLGAYAPASTTTAMCGGSVLTTHQTTETFDVYTQPPYSVASPAPEATVGQNDTLGLQKFYDYRTIQTGAGSSANVNLGTGNLVWQDAPVSDPGQGLSTNVQVTYNSQQRLSDLNLVNNTAGATVATQAYDQIGQGFSLGIDGLTRLNDPLDLSQEPLGEISFTGVDGERHTFVQGSSGQWIAPPGIFLHLRAWNQSPFTTSTWDKAWGITSPDGVTYFFDGLGYESSIQDRTGNTITFNRTYSALGLINLASPTQSASATGSVCQGTSAAGLATTLLGVGCAERVTSVVDQNGRSMGISYNNSVLASGVPSFANGAGLVASITDHAGHVLQFAYDSTGDLKSMTLSPGGTSQRTFTFGWGGANDTIPALSAVPALTDLTGLGSGVNATLFPAGLTSITDPDGHTTSVTYCANGATTSNGQAAPCTQNLPAGDAGPCPGAATSLTSSVEEQLGTLLNLEPKCVTQITDRAPSGTTSFTYNQQQNTSADSNCAASALECTAVTGPQTNQNGNSEVWTDSIDQAFRPIEQVDPLGRTTLTTWNNPTTATSWGICTTSQSENTSNPCDSGPGNTTAGTIHGAGSSVSTTTLYSYEQNGLMTEQEGPAYTASPSEQAFRETTITYQESAGPSSLQSPTGSDANGQFVADETQQEILTGPDSNQKTTYSYDSTDPHDGLVTSITDADGTWQMSYYPGTAGHPSATGSGTTDAGGGLIKSETDPDNDVSYYGNAVNQYLATAPLGQNAGYDPNGLPELIYAPGQSGGGSNPVAPTTYQYDADGNVIAVSDPRNASPTPIPGADWSPGADPTVTASTVTQPYTTYHAYDSLNEDTETWLPKSTGTGGTDTWIQDQTTFDSNGNVLSTTVGGQLTNGSNDTSVTPTITTYTYSPMDQRASQIVQNVPSTEVSPQDGSSQTTLYCYDLNGNLTDEVLPAGYSQLANSCNNGTDPGGDPPIGSNHAVHYVVDADGEVLVKEQLSSTTGTQNQLTSYAYNALGDQVGTADPVDNVGATAVAAEANAQLATSGTAAAWRTETIYDAAGQPIDEVENPDASDGRVYQTLSQYDGAGELVATMSAKEYANVTSGGTAPTLDSSSGEYDLAGNSGNTTYNYDGRGLLDSTVDPDGYETLYGRRADGKICWIMSADGVAYEQGQGQALPSSSNCSSTATSLPYVTSYTYSAQGWLQQIALPKAPNEYSYNAPLEVVYGRNYVGDPTSITTPNGKLMTNWFYDTGDLEATNMPWWWTFDSKDSNSSGPDPNTGGDGQVASSTPDEGLQVQERSLSDIYAQDQANSKAPSLPSDGVSGSLGDVSAESLPGVLPNAGETGFQYDGHMWLTKVTDAIGYNGTGNPAPQFTSVPTATTTLSWDPDGNMTQLSQPFNVPSAMSTTAWSYDPDGNLLSETTPPRATVPSSSLPLGYQGATNAVNAGDETTAAQTTTTYSYDGLDRVSSVTAPGAQAAPGGQTIPDETTAYCYYLAPMGGSDTASQQMSSCPADNGAARLKVPEPEGISFEVAQRVLTIDPDGHGSTTDYDSSGNVLATTDPLGNETTNQYDELGDQTATVRPKGQNGSQTPLSNYTTSSIYDQDGRLSSQTDGSGFKTSYTYDANANLIEQDAPGAAASNGGAVAPQITTYSYNGRGLLWTTTTGTGSLATYGADGQQNARTTVTETDGDGNVIRTVNPAGVNSTTGAAWYSYDDSYTTAGPGSDDPSGDANVDATIRVFDQNNQLETAYLPWGCDLTANTAPAQCQAASAADTRRWRIDYGRTTPGTDGGDWTASVSEAYDWTQSNPKIWTTDFTYQPNGWISGQTSPQLDDALTGGNYTTSGGTQQVTDYSYDPAGDQIQAFEAGTGPSQGLERTISRTWWPNGQPQATDGSPGTGVLQRSEGYYWEPTGQVSQAIANVSNSSTPAETETACYDAAGRLQAADQWLATPLSASSPQFDTFYAYDADGNQTGRDENGEYGVYSSQQNTFACPTLSQGSLPSTSSTATSNDYTRGQESQFVYNNLDKETSTSVASNPGDNPQQPGRTFTNTYWPSGQRESQTRGSSVTEKYYYDDSGQIAEDTNSALGTDTTYSYDTDGNRTSSENGAHVYNPLDQEVEWTRGGDDNTANAGASVYYQYDGDGDLQKDTTTNVVKNATIDGVSGIGATEQVTHLYCSEGSAPTPASGETASTAWGQSCQLDGGRAENAQTYATDTITGITSPPPEETTEHECYNALGQSTGTVQGNTCASGDGTTESSYGYNVFGQQVNATVPYPTTASPNQTLNTISAYDALGRRIETTQTLSGQQPSSPSAESYLGLSDSVSWAKGTTPTGGTYVNSYDYDSAGNPLGLYTTATNAYYSYSLDQQGSVLGLEGANGQVATDDQYHYTPSGELELGENQLDTGNLADLLGMEPPDQALSAEAQANQTLYEGYQYNGGEAPSGDADGTPSTDSYTTPARTYLPSQTSYLTPDTFEQSTAEQQLLGSAQSQGVYAFQAGNPTTYTDPNGHIGSCSDGHCEVPASDGRTYVLEYDQTVEYQHGHVVSYTDDEDANAPGGTVYGSQAQQDANQLNTFDKALTTAVEQVSTASDRAYIKAQASAELNGCGGGFDGFLCNAGDTVGNVLETGAINIGAGILDLGCGASADVPGGEAVVCGAAEDADQAALSQDEEEIDALTGAAEDGSEVLLDTSAVKARGATRALLGEGETPVICSTVACEAAEQGFDAGGLSIVPDGVSAVLRGRVATALRAFGASAQGFANDATIGATALERGSPLITGDRALYNAVTSLGGDARLIRPGG